MIGAFERDRQAGAPDLGSGQRDRRTELALVLAARLPETLTSTARSVTADALSGAAIAALAAAEVEWAAHNGRIALVALLGIALDAVEAPASS
jgi:hypothetical protein